MMNVATSRQQKFHQIERFGAIGTVFQPPTRSVSSERRSASKIGHADQLPQWRGTPGNHPCRGASHPYNQVKAFDLKCCKSPLGGSKWLTRFPSSSNWTDAARQMDFVFNQHDMWFVIQVACCGNFKANAPFARPVACHADRAAATP
jgi:hypothetical protein